MKKENMLIALVGMSGSGKSYVSKYLKENSWEIIRFGDITMIELTSRNMPIDETHERIIREELREKHGKGAYAKLSIARIKNMIKESNTVIDGLYSWSEYKILKKELDIDLKTILIHTDKDIRYSRLRNREERPLTEKEAISRDISEIENLEKGGPIAFADYILVNNSTPKALEQALKNLLSIIQEDL